MYYRYRESKKLSYGSILAEYHPFTGYEVAISFSIHQIDALVQLA